MKTNNIKSKTIIISSIYVFSFMILFLLKSFFVYNLSPSTPKGLYFIKFWDKNINIGDFVLLDNPRPDLSKFKKIIKRVSTLHNNLCSLKGDTQLSLDSRYYGDIEKDKLVKLIKF